LAACHEFIHVLHPGLEHGPKFDQETQKLMGKLNLYEVRTNLWKALFAPNESVRIS